MMMIMLSCLFLLFGHGDISVYCIAILYFSLEDAVIVARLTDGLWWWCAGPMRFAFQIALKALKNGVTFWREYKEKNANEWWSSLWSCLSGEY